MDNKASNDSATKILSHQDYNIFLVFLGMVSSLFDKGLKSISFLCAFGS